MSTVIPVNDDGQVYVVCDKDGKWCFPSGPLSGSETQVECATRILDETLGVKPCHLSPMGSPCSSYVLCTGHEGEITVDTSTYTKGEWVDPNLLGNENYPTTPDTLKYESYWKPVL